MTTIPSRIKQVPEKKNCKSWKWQNGPCLSSQLMLGQAHLSHQMFYCFLKSLKTIKECQSTSMMVQGVKVQSEKKWFHGDIPPPFASCKGASPAVPEALPAKSRARVEPDIDWLLPKPPKPSYKIVFKCLQVSPEPLVDLFHWKQLKTI